MLNNYINFEFQGYANAFFRTSLIEAWGRGIEKIHNTCKNENVHLPEISFDGCGFWLKFSFNKKLSKLTPETAPVTAPERDLKTPELIIAILQERPDVTLKFVADKIGNSLRAVKDATKKLQLEGRLKRIGFNKSGYWKVINTEVKTAPEISPETAPEMSVKKSTKTKDMILDLLNVNPEMTLSEVAEEIGKSLRTVKNATNKLQDEGKLERIDPNKGGYWEVNKLDKESQKSHKTNRRKKCINMKLNKAIFFSFSVLFSDFSGCKERRL